MREIHFLAQFLALMHVRGPKIRKAIIEHMQIETYEKSKILADRPHLLRQFLNQKRPVLNGRPVQAEELAEILRNTERDCRVEVDPTAALINCIKAVEPLPPLLYRMNWIICDAPNGSHFVTSDTPVCSFLPTAPKRAKLGVGFGMRNVEVSDTRCAAGRRPRSGRILGDPGLSEPGAGAGRQSREAPEAEARGVEARRVAANSVRDPRRAAP
jgi:hypothetical protein